MRKSARPLGWPVAAPAIVDPAAGDAAHAQLGPDDVEQLQRHRLRYRRAARDWTPVRPESVPRPPPKRTPVGAIRQPSPSRVSTAALSSDQRPPVDLAAAGDADPVRA